MKAARERRCRRRSATRRSPRPTRSNHRSPRRTYPLSHLSPSLACRPLASRLSRALRCVTASRDDSKGTLPAAASDRRGWGQPWSRTQLPGTSRCPKRYGCLELSLHYDHAGRLALPGQVGLGQLGQARASSLLPSGRCGVRQPKWIRCRLSHGPLVSREGIGRHNRSHLPVRAQVGPSAKAARATRTMRTSLAAATSRGTSAAPGTRRLQRSRVRLRSGDRNPRYFAATPRAHEAPADPLHVLVKICILRITSTA
jgi:hypothetical protein